MSTDIRLSSPPPVSSLPFLGCGLLGRKTIYDDRLGSEERGPLRAVDWLQEADRYYSDRPSL